ncbi:MAG: hypothetical protein IKF90_13705 [Parasporobacterium sp.]|nr:hypothetical protein [Parasporobacterium sp.]
MRKAIIFGIVAAILITLILTMMSMNSLRESDETIRRVDQKIAEYERSH